jgi:regulator of nucleoside diphosphate kinase
MLGFRSRHLSFHSAKRRLVSSMGPHVFRRAERAVETCDLRNFSMSQNPANRLPKITVTEPDFESLSRIASASLDAFPDVAGELLRELDRARVVAERSAKPDVVRMNSVVSYRLDDGSERRVVLVYPAAADISQSRVSIMTPIGTALIGLKEGQSITWTNRTGKRQQLTVLAVQPPAADLS